MNWNLVGSIYGRGYTNDLKGYDRLYLFYYSIESIQILFSLRYMSIYFTKKYLDLKDYESRDCMTWIMERSTIVGDIFFITGQNWFKFSSVWGMSTCIYFTNNIYIFLLILCISGDILTWRTTNRAIAWLENGNTDL
jgi:hypothetical protein